MNSPFYCAGDTPIPDDEIVTENDEDTEDDEEEAGEDFEEDEVEDKPADMTGPTKK